MNPVETLSADGLLKGLLDLLPFKGKGEVRRQRDQAWQDWQATARAIKALSHEFRQQFSASLPVTLAVMRGRHFTTFLRWRGTARGQQTTLILCEDAQGLELLRQLPAPTRAALLRYDVRAMSLNAACQMYAYQHRMLDDFLAKLEAWERVSDDHRTS